MFTTTLEQREAAGITSIDKQLPPVDYNSGERKDEAHALALDNKKIRVLDDKEMEIKDVLNFRDAKMLQAIKANEKIPERKYLNVPYAKHNNRLAA